MIIFYKERKARLNPCRRRMTRASIPLLMSYAYALLFQEFLGGRQMLSDYKSKADSFVCSIVPGSGSAQFQTTPGTCT